MENATRTPVDLEGLGARLTGRLARLRRRVRVHLLLAGLLPAAALAPGMGLASFFLDRWLRLSAGLRLALLALGILYLLRLVWRAALRPLRGLDPLALARALD